MPRTKRVTVQQIQKSINLSLRKMNRRRTVRRDPLDILGPRQWWIVAKQLNMPRNQVERPWIRLKYKGDFQITASDGFWEIFRFDRYGDTVVASGKTMASLKTALFKFDSVSKRYQFPRGTKQR